MVGRSLTESATLQNILLSPIYYKREGLTKKDVDGANKRPNESNELSLYSLIHQSDRQNEKNREDPIVQ